MSAIKKYFKDELQWRKIDVEHSRPAEFYLSVWQTNRSSAPLLVLRSLLFLTCVAITLTSMIFYILKGRFGYWFIYLTHWGLTVMTVAAAFSLVVSARSHFKGPISGEYRLPWYVKAFWTTYNIAVPVAFLITVFYWTVLYEAGVEEELNHGLDVAVHGINTVMMFVLLVTASQPSRLLHIYHPLLFALTYFLFGLIYYLAGGTNPDGQPWVYAVVNWSKPGVTVGVATVTGLLLVLLYVLVISLAQARDAVSRKFVKPGATENGAPESVALRQPGQTDV